MAKKRKSKSRNRSAQSAAALRLNGIKAFQGGNYLQAIQTWERIPESLRPDPALAEAYFRQGLDRFYGPEPHQHAGLEDFQKALESLLNEKDDCYFFKDNLVLGMSGRYENGEITDKVDLEKIEDKIITTTIKVQGSDKAFMYYYGPCQ